MQTLMMDGLMLTYQRGDIEECLSEDAVFILQTYNSRRSSMTLFFNKDCVRSCHQTLVQDS